MSNITTTVLSAAIIVLQIVALSVGLVIQELQESEHLLSQRVTALERELLVSSGYKVDRWRALAAADGSRR